MTGTATLLPPGTELWISNEELTLRHGGTLAPLRIAFELAGPADAPLIAVLGGISADHHPFSTASDARPGWWEPFGGPARAIDTDRFRVLGIDYIGGSGLSSGPRAATGSIAPADQAEVLAKLLDQLEVPALHAIVGCSYGGMVALEFASRFPERTQSAVVIAAAHENHPLATAWRSIQRRIVRLGLGAGAAAEALAIARALGIATYRSAEEFADRFAGAASLENSVLRFPVDGYLDAQGARFASHFDPAAFLCLSESIDLHSVDPASVRVPVTVIAFSGDQLVPPAQARQLAGRLAGQSSFVEIASRYGHDGFLKEVESLGPVLRRALGEVAQ